MSTFAYILEDGSNTSVPHSFPHLSPSPLTLYITYTGTKKTSLKTKQLVNSPQFSISRLVLFKSFTTSWSNLYSQAKFRHVSMADTATIRENTAVTSCPIVPCTHHHISHPPCNTELFSMYMRGMTCTALA